MQTEKKSTGLFYRVLKIVLKTILFLVLFVVVVFLLILTPPVQRFATSKVENFLEKKLQTKVEIGSIAIGLPRKVLLENIYIEDRTKDTLLSGGTIKVDITLLKLLSNEVEIRNLEINDVTAKVKRTLPDTAFNFQFIIDAFVTQKEVKTDTAQAAPLKLAVDKLSINKSRIVYKDVLTGNDMATYIGNLTAVIDTLDLTHSVYSIPSFNLTGLRSSFQQEQPLAIPQSAASDLAEAAEPITMRLNLGKINLLDIQIAYGNGVSALQTNFSIEKLFVEGEQLDLKNRLVHLNNLELTNAVSIIKLGKTASAKQLQKQVEQEVEAQQQQGWTFQVNEVRINDNAFQFDNDNTPAKEYGIDFAHMKADSLSLHVDDLIFSTDSISGRVIKGYFKEKSGFQLDALEGDLLYASSGAHLKNLLIKTPGTEIKRTAILEYASFEALTKRPAETIIDIDIDKSFVQVKDILAFVPQLRTHPAFSNSADVWNLNVQGSGNMSRLQIGSLQFDGLKNTVLDASGTLSGLNDPKAAGGDFTIRRLHTSQTDLSLFTGARLSNAQVNLPETFAAKGTVSGNMSAMSANFAVATAAGNVAIKGRFSNLTSPSQAKYNTTITATSLQLGSILRNKVPVGTLSATFTLDGKGFTPESINTRFRGMVNSVGYNNYTYRNVSLNGALNGNAFSLNTNIADPNIDLTLATTGNIKTSTFRINATVDSVKALPLHFATQALVFRGKIDADINASNPDLLDASVFVTDALVVSGTNRLPIDTLQLTAGSNDTAAQYISLRSEIANADIAGTYRLADLGSIIQSNLKPYFSVATTPVITNVKPYDFSFTLDLTNSPVLAAFMPDLKITQPIHAEGRLATGQGMQALANAPLFAFGTNEISGLSINALTTPAGLEVTANVARLKSGNSLDIFKTRINARALNNIIYFNLGVADANAKDKYNLGGVFSQPSKGTYALQLNADSLLLNYERWTVAANNRLVIAPESISATDFTLSKGVQQLSINSLPGASSPLNVAFKSFQLGTLTGFMKSDSILVDGTMNGSVTLTNLMKQPLFTSDLTIGDFSLKGDTIGNINLQVANTTANRYNTAVTITGRGNDVALTGYFLPQGKDIVLNLDLAVRKLDLSNLEGALATFIKSASGAINGDVSIKGTAAKPRVQGALNFDKAVITTLVIGGPLSINNEQLKVTENGFVFDRFDIKDSSNNALTIDGNVSTTNFINYAFDLDVDARNFRALNTTKQDNKIFYGQLNINTDLHISGTETKPTVDGSLSINDGTAFNVVIPQAEPGLVDREGVVQFVDFDSPENDSLFLAYDSLNTTDILGFELAVNIDIKKEAIFNVVVDAANGDFLNVRGQGQLTTGIDPSGKITMTGTYEIEEGGYQFSFNFIRRKFEIEKGSKMTWLGAPTDAQVDITAKYVANTAPLDLVQDQIDVTQRNFYLQKLPFQVLLNLDGELLTPLLTFDIT
ncbi:MAG: translocation/assembly module TamB domain-containing protein, partial [Chitinophagaceae bacterium]